MLCLGAFGPQNSRNAAALALRAPGAGFIAAVPIEVVAAPAPHRSAGR